MSKILMVEDERSLATNVKEWLEFEHYLVEHADNGTDALDLLKTYSYDLVILDVNLPRMSGLEVCKLYRSSGGQTPILMLTGNSGLSDKEAGFESGVDDYLTKPFEMKELSWRIRALLRRPRTAPVDVLTVGALSLDPVGHHLTRRGKKIHLPRMEFMLLEFFMRAPGQIFSPTQLLDSVWKSESERTAESIRTSIKKLRQKIDEPGQPSMISNVHGVGYKLELLESDEQS